jgi:hypothetical protein
MAPTRRTHVVRVHAETGGAGQYFDVEVLDAIAFRDNLGKEVVLSMPKEKVVPWIVDDTGDGSEKSPADPTRRTHMKRITGDANNFFDVEVLDAAAFVDLNGGEWVLNMPADNASSFNTTDGTGNNNATRRTHNEQVSDNPSIAAPADYITVERCDMVAFRKGNGAEVILKMPSSDDPNSSDPRADTVIDPEGYDPTNPASPTPPDLDASGDQHVFAKFLPDGGVSTKDVKVSQGPLWWIRKTGSGNIIFCLVEYHCNSNLSGTPPRPTAQLIGLPYAGNFSVLADVTVAVPGAIRPRIVNPVTDGMLNAYFQWTPTPLVESTSQSSFPGTTVYWISVSHSPGYFAGYVWAAGGPPAPPTPTNYNVPAVYLNADGSPAGSITPLQFYGPNAVSLVGQPANMNGANSYASLADANAAVATFNQVFAFLLANFPGSENENGFSPSIQSFQIGAPLSASTLSGIAVFEINYDKLKDAIGKNNPKAPITFKIAVSCQASGSTSDATITATAEVYKKLRNFSLDPQNNPTFTPWNKIPPLPTAKDGGKSDGGGISANNGGSVSGTLIFTIDPKTLDCTFTQA